MQRDRESGGGISSYLTGQMWRDLVGPDAESDIRRAIERYGAHAVYDAAVKLAKPKRGPRTIDDWSRLKHVTQQDAVEWLAGLDPLKLRTNYAVAQKFAREHPGHSYDSTRDRLEGKLRLERKIRMLQEAADLSFADHPHKTYLKALKELAALGAEPRHEGGPCDAEWAMLEFEGRFGKRPPARHSFLQIRCAVGEDMLRRGR
jgi:hypothetical protein